MRLRQIGVLGNPPMGDRLRRQFGEHLRQVRLKTRMTQEEFSELLGISVDFLSLIERGINAPSFEKLEQIAERLGVPVAFLFTFGETYRPQRGRR